VPFIIGNAGIIPNELSRKKNAAQEEIFSPGDIDLAGFNPAQSRIRKIAYQRRVKVGHIRAFNDADGNCLNLPKIPEDVYPRLRDLKLDDTAKSHEHPLILLAPFPAWEKKGAIQTFNFKLRLPATDINTWDRWVARGEIYGETINDTGTVKLKDLRVGVWADYHTRHDRTRNNQGCKPVLQNDDATLDDPALAPHLVAELFKFVSGAWSQIGVAVPLNVTRNSLAKSITAAQSQSVSVNCVSTLENVQKIEASGDKKTLTVTVKKGELYKLKISCCLPTAYYGASTAADIKPFARIYEDTPFETTTIDGAIFNKISPFETFIEVATDEIAPSNISALITPKFHEQMKFSENGVESFADLMEVRFLRDKVNRVDEEFPYIYKAELQRQVWRWQGRETNPHPQILEEKPTAAAITRWEVKEYGNRFDLDHTIMNMDSRVSETGSAPNAKKATGSRIFSYSEYLTGEKAKKEELRALHYRFRVTVHSRYAGIMPAGGLFVDKWVSEFVPCRVKAPIKVPKPKLIFPLTQSFGSPSSGTAGLLVVLDEPWYEVGGIGESLGAEVIRTPDPKNIPDKPNLATDKFYFEIGADPIVSEQALNVGSPEKITVSFDENKTSQIRGPVGHTFDRSSDAPLFVSTSFIIPAPSIIKDPVSAPGAAFGAWGMCKLRLRRVIHVKPKPVTREGEKTVSLKSEFTDPFWVQYLPEFSLFNINGDFSNLQLKISPNSNSLQAEVVDSGNQNVKLEAGKTDPNGKNLFELYMVLTREVFDATGRSDQEVYVGVLAQSGNIWQTADDSGIFNDETFPDNAAKQRKLDSIKFRARIIEIQRRKNGNTAFMNADKLWEHLFEPHIQDKDRCRIVRISEPLGSGATFEKC
jgi:hypothetical protein